MELNIKIHYCEECPHNFPETTYNASKTTKIKFIE